MSPVDGNWGGTSENVSAIVTTDLSLNPGKHYILVHGRNTQGKWGPFTAVFFQVTQPQYAMQLTATPDSGSADPGQRQLPSLGSGSGCLLRIALPDAGADPGLCRRLSPHYPDGTARFAA